MTNSVAADVFRGDISTYAPFVGPALRRELFARGKIAPTKDRHSGLDPEPR